MSRRPLQHPIGRLAKAQQRMAPGGILWSESPIPRAYRPVVPMVGDPEPPPPVLPTTYGSWFQAAYNYDFPTGSASADALHPTSPKTVGDMFLSLVMVDGGASVPTFTAPTGWATLGSGSSGLVKWVLVGINSYTGAEGTTWTFSGLTDDTDWSSYYVFVVHLRGASGLTWTSALSTTFPGTKTGTWQTPDPGWSGAVSFAMVAGSKSGVAGRFTPVPAGSTGSPPMYGIGGSYVVPNPDPRSGTPATEIFDDPRPSGSFTWSNPGGVDYERPGGVHTFAVTVGLV